jgi:hypothetical protein
MDNELLKTIKSLWKTYKAATVLSCMKEGKWNHTKVIPGEIPKPDGTTCKMQPLSNVIEFPEYLETYCD